MITDKDIAKLKYYARDLAIMMEPEDIERVIVAFVEVMNLKNKYRRWP
jgi:hypothetical protein